MIAIITITSGFCSDDDYYWSSGLLVSAASGILGVLVPPRVRFV